jgi:hypothetical protein
MLNLRPYLGNLVVRQAIRPTTSFPPFQDPISRDVSIGDIKNTVTINIALISKSISTAW